MAFGLEVRCANASVYLLAYQPGYGRCGFLVFAGQYVVVVRALDKFGSFHKLFRKYFVL